MIKVLIGKKGTGKTKTLIEAVNKTAGSANGNIVFIGKDTKRHIYDLDHSVRLVSTSEFQISNYNEFYGFLCGIISNDYDITNIYIDSISKIIGDGLDGLDEFFKKIENLSKTFSISFFFTISLDPDNTPGYLTKYA